MANKNQGQSILKPMVQNKTELKFRQVDAGNIKIGDGKPLVLIAGPCVIEDEEKTCALAEKLKTVALALDIPLIFKASFDKANRTSVNAYRGPGLVKGLDILAKIKSKLNLPVLSDIHSINEVGPASEVLDIIQIPAFLCRQTDIVSAVARTGKVVNVKKGQFLAPNDMKFVVEKITVCGNHRILLTERGSTFGYNNLVVDMRSLVIMKDLGYPVVFDATHSVQLPGAGDSVSGGDSRFIAPLARAAAAAGIDALFLEIHETPETALCDGPNSLKLSELGVLMKQVVYHSK